MRKQLKLLHEKIVRLETRAHTARAVALGHPAVDAALENGLRAGALHEVFAAERHAPAATGFALMLALRIAPEKTLFWVQQEFSASVCGELSPMGFLELGFDPCRLVFIRVTNPVDALRAAADALACKALGTVVLESWGEAKIFDPVASRRLTLAAAQAGVAMIHLRLAAAPKTSTAETRWLIESAPSRADDNPAVSAVLSRNRHGRTGRFSMEWSCDERIFREPAHSRAVAAAIDDRPSAAPRGEVPFRRAG